LEDRASVSGAIEAWLPAAMEGDAKAQNYMGQLLERAEGNSQDYDMARLWYERAAKQGLSEAMFNLARMYEHGHGVEKDKGQSDYWYRRAYGFDDEFAANVILVDSREFEALKAKTAEQSSTIQSLNKEIVQLKTQISALEKDVSLRQSKLDQAINRSNKLEAELAVSRSALADTIERNKTPIIDVDRSIQDLEKAKKQLAENEAELEQKLKQFEIERKTLVSLAAQDNAATTKLSNEIHELQSQLEQQKKLNASLKLSYDIASEGQSTARMELAAQRKELNEFLSRLQLKEQALADLEYDLISREKSLNNSQEQLQLSAQKSLDTERNKLKSERQLLETERKIVAQKVALYTEKFNELKSLSQKTEQERKKLDQSDSELKTRLAIVIEREKKLAQAGSTAVSAKMANLPKLEAQIKKDRHSIDNLKSSLDLKSFTLNEREEALLEQFSKLEKDMAQLKIKEAQVKQREQETEATRIAAAAALEELNKVKEQLSLLSSTGIKGQRSIVQQDVSKPIDRPEYRVNFGNYHALLIGNQHYESPDWPDLDTSLNDVRKISSILRNKYGFETTVLEDAPRFEILQAISELGSTLGPNDNLLIYFAGHGQYIDKITTGYWEPVDSIPYKTINSISVQNINAQLRLTEARKVLVVSDSCYSGAFTRAPVAILSENVDHAMRERYLRQIAEKRSRNVMTAGGLKPVADGLGNGHSLFASALISTLSSNDDIVLGRDLFSDVRDIVTVTASKHNWDQEPEYDEIVHSGHEGGDFVFVPANNG
jgi:hypothetical protein